MAFAQSPLSKWDIADMETKRLPPSSFPNLPASIVDNLESRGCTIPQAYITPKPHNVIQGVFSESQEIDWAILCSIDRISSILVYWGASYKNVSEIAKGPDKRFLQEIRVGQIGFSRDVSVAGKNFIMRHYEYFGGSKPPPIDHKGIDDAFVEKGSIVLYYYRGEWLRLTGAD